MWAFIGVGVKGAHAHFHPRESPFYMHIVVNSVWLWICRRYCFRFLCICAYIWHRIHMLYYDVPLHFILYTFSSADCCSEVLQLCLDIVSTNRMNVSTLCTDRNIYRPTYLPYQCHIFQEQQPEAYNSSNIMPIHEYSQRMNRCRRMPPIFRHIYGGVKVIQTVADRSRTHFWNYFLLRICEDSDQTTGAECAKSVHNKIMRKEAEDFFLNALPHLFEFITIHLNRIFRFDLLKPITSKIPRMILCIWGSLRYSSKSDQKHNWLCQSRATYKKFETSTFR